MGHSQWQQYFDQKAATHGASVKSSDYFDDDSFFVQRDHILQWIGPLAGKRILDAGCGVGAFSEPWTPANAVVGVDFSEKSLEFAAARGLQTLSADLTALPFESGSFDLVVCIGVIQLIENYQPVLAELARGRDYEAFDRSLDVAISRLRKIIETDAAHPRYIQTVWGVGYVFVPDNAEG